MKRVEARGRDVECNCKGYFEGKRVEIRGYMGPRVSKVLYTHKNCEGKGLARDSIGKQGRLTTYVSPSSSCSSTSGSRALLKYESRGLGWWDESKGV